MKRQKRKVVLLVDNCFPHVIASRDLTLSNINLLFIKPNLTSVLQPCDAGIIASFKAIYKRLFLEEISIKSEQNTKQDINLKEGLCLIGKAWNLVSQLTIVNCWKKVNIFAPAPASVVDHTEDEDNELAKLSELIQKFNSMNPIQAEEYLRVEEVIESNDFSVKTVGDEILIEHTNKISIESSSNSSSEEQEPIGIQEGIVYLKKTLSLLELQDFVNPSDIMRISELIKIASTKEFNHIKGRAKQLAITDFLVNK